MSPVPVRWILGAVGVVLLALAAWWLVATVTGGKTARVTAELEAGRGDAMAESGADAVGTVGGRNAEDDRTDGRVKETQDAIDDKSDASELGGADAVARGGLCQQSPDYCR